MNGDHVNPAFIDVEEAFDTADPPVASSDDVSVTIQETSFDDNHNEGVGVVVDKNEK